jgi:hypothetical protein
MVRNKIIVTLKSPCGNFVVLKYTCGFKDLSAQFLEVASIT